MERHAPYRTDDGRPPTDLAPARPFADHRAILLKALSALAAAGYAAPPGEGMDLIHDFYVEAWADISGRYDPSRAKFETYLFACFVRFARPRIARLARFRAALMAPADLERLAQDRGPVPPDETDAADLPSVRAALDALPADGRALLEAYLDDGEPSERVLAERFGLTRHAVRVRLTEMLGLVAIRLGAASSLGEPDRSIAVMLWAHHRSPHVVAHHLGLSTETVQRAKVRVFTRLVEAVRGSRTMSFTAQYSFVTSSSTPASLVAAALSSTATARDLAAVRQQAGEIYAYLDTIRSGRDADMIQGADAARLASFYGALADALDGSPRDEPKPAPIHPLILAREADDAGVTEALEVLLASVPEGWARFRQLFEHIAVADDAEVAILLAQPAMRHASREVREMARYGITPVVAAQAMRSISNTAMGFCRRQDIRRDGRFRIVIHPSGSYERGLPMLDRQEVEEELRLDVELPEQAAAALCQWILGVAADLPSIFDGFDTRSAGGGTLVLTRTDRSEPDLFKRWRARD